MEAHQEELLGPQPFLCSSSPSIYFDFNSFSTASIRPNCSERQQPLLMTSSCSVTTPGLGQPVGSEALLLTTICPTPPALPSNAPSFGSTLIPLISEQFADNAAFEWTDRPKLGQLQLETRCAGLELASQLFATEGLFNAANENGSNAALLNFNGAVEKQEAVYLQTMQHDGCDKFAAEFALGHHHISSLASTSTEYTNGTSFHEIPSNNNNYYSSTYTDSFQPIASNICTVKEELCLTNGTKSAELVLNSKASPARKYARKKLKNGAKSNSKLQLQKQNQKKNLLTTSILTAPNSSIDSNPTETIVCEPVFCNSEFEKEDTCKRLTEGQENRVCFQCHKEINDQFIMSVNNSPYHASCLKCCICEQDMEQLPTCFLKDDSLFCKTCYLQKFQSKCISCNRQIQATDWVRRARSFLYHLACFSCDHCKRQLSTGEQFSIQENRLLCKQHYMELIQGDDSHAKQKTKRVRTTFAEEQIGILQAHFQVDCNPDGSDLERIANLTGLSKRVTQVWFQNSRARQKKYQGTKKSGRSVSGISGESGGGDSFSASINSGHSSPGSNMEGNTEDGMIFPTSVTTSTDDITSEDHHHNSLCNIENMADSDNYMDN